MSEKQTIVRPSGLTKEDFNLESFGDLLGQLDKAGATPTMSTTPAERPDSEKKKPFFRFLRLGF